MCVNFFLLKISRVILITGPRILKFGTNIEYDLYCVRENPLRKHAYSNILKISPPKTENFQIKKSDIFHNSAQSIDEYPQSMF